MRSRVLADWPDLGIMVGIESVEVIESLARVALNK